MTPGRAADADRAVRREGWRAALACCAALSVAMGLGRFAFTPLLPVMLAEGKFDLHGGGVLASLNYLGYFIGAVSCAAIRARASLMVRVGLVSTAILLIGMGLAEQFAAWSVLRAAAGVMSAWTFVFVSGWGLRRLAETRSSALAGVIYTGPGIGITATGALGGLLAQRGSEAGWIGCGVLAVIVLAIVWRVFDDRPAQSAGSQAPLATAPVGRPPDTRADSRWLVALYGIAGFGYIITATFLPVIARQALPGSSWPDLFWPLFGLAVIPGALIGSRAPQHWDNRMLLSIGYAMQATGVVLSVVWPTLWGFALGSLLLGLPFTAVTLFAMREARRLRGNAAAGLIGFATASYGLGQIVGPLFAAPLAQRTASFALPLLVAAGALALGGAAFAWIWLQARARPAGAS